MDTFIKRHGLNWEFISGTLHLVTEKHRYQFGHYFNNIQEAIMYIDRIQRFFIDE